MAPQRRQWVVVAALCGCSCGADPVAGAAVLFATGGEAPDASGDVAESGVLEGGTPTTSTGAIDDSGSAESSTTDDAPPPASRVDDLELLCKLVNAGSIHEPTANATHTRFNLRATDLGVPLVIGDRLHLFFGDTHGYREIWSIGEDPDAVGYADAAAVADDPSVLCSALSFYVTPDVPSVAADTDPSVQRDFAVGWMLPPPGEDVSAYVGRHAPAFPNVPGSFEVPSGALAVGDAAYIFWAGMAELEPRARMTLGYLVRWDAPRDVPVYQIVRPVDALDDGPLGGHFIQVLPFVQDDTVYLLGTGEFRRTGIHLARMPLASLETGEDQEVYDPHADAWIDPASLDFATRAAIPPVVESDGVGELGGVFVPGPDVFLVMYQRAEANAQGLVSNRVYARTAADLTGPWSEALVVIDMFDPDFVAAHCCVQEPCADDQIWQCAQAGLYAAYPLPSPRVTPQPDGTFAVDLPFVVSTWIPYNVVLFEVRLVLAGA